LIEIWSKMETWH